MASSIKNLSDYQPELVPDGSGYSIGIVASDWNKEVTGALLNGAADFLLEHGVLAANIVVKRVPGTYELTFAAAHLMNKHKYLDAIIVLGCVVQGETKHFDFICQGVSAGISELNAKGNIPVIFGVLTTDNQQQATDRAGGKHGNKGIEAAYTALKMADVAESISSYK